MTSGDCAIIIDRGGVFQVAFRLRDENRDPVDLTNAVAEFQIKPDYDDPATIDLDSENQSSQVVIDQDTSLVTVSLTSTQTALLTASSYVFRFNTISNGQTSRWVRGTVTVKD
jgi:hypothetical protein